MTGAADTMTAAARTKRNAGGVMHGLPRGAYTERAVLAAEYTHVFAPSWCFVGFAHELANPGDARPVTAAGQPVVLLRNATGDIRAFHNVCRHRGTRLCDDRSGSFKRHIVCPYHSWAYELTGDLAAAPSMDDVDGFDRADLPLHALATFVWEGLVFVCFDKTPKPFETAFASIFSKFSAWSLPDLVPVHRTEYEVEANWKLLFQNYSECYHCPTLHPALNRLTPYRDSENDLESGPVLGGPMRLTDGSESMTMEGRACAAPLPGADGVSPRLVWYYVVFPSFFLSIMPDYVLIHRVRRRGPAASTVVCEWMFHPSAVQDDAFDPSGAIEFWDMTNRQDWRICEQAQLGVASRAYTPGPYSDLESMIAALDQEYLSALEK